MSYSCITSDTENNKTVRDIILDTMAHQEQGNSTLIPEEHAAKTEK